MTSGRAAVAAQPLADRRHHRLARRCDLEDRAVGLVPVPVRQKRRVDARRRPRQRSVRRRRRGRPCARESRVGVRTNWRIGIASNSSLAASSRNPPGTSSKLVVPGDPFGMCRRASASARPAAAGSFRPDGSWRCRRGRVRAWRRRAACPPSSCRGRGRSRRSARPCGLPCFCQACTMKTPSISPKSWLTSGAVTKSPSRPKGSRVR